MSSRERILTWLFWLIGLTNVLRVIVGLYLAPVLFNVPLSFSPVGWIGCSLVWSVIFIIAALLPRGHTFPWAWRLILIYQGWIWGVSLLFDRSVYARTLWRRDVLFSLLSMLVAWALTHPLQRSRFHLT